MAGFLGNGRMMIPEGPILVGIAGWPNFQYQKLNLNYVLAVRICWRKSVRSQP